MCYKCWQVIRKNGNKQTMDFRNLCSACRKVLCVGTLCVTCLAAAVDHQDHSPHRHMQTDIFKNALTEISSSGTATATMPFTTNQPPPIHWQYTFQMPLAGQKNAWLTASTT